MRCDSCLSLPVFFWCSRSLLHDGQWYSLCTSFRPTNECRTVFSAPILLSRPTCPRFVCLSSKHSLDRLQPYSLPSAPHARALPSTLFQWTILACFKSIFFTSCGQITLMSTLWPPDAKIKGLAQNCSCKSSHLLPGLHLGNLLPPCLMHFFSPSVHPHTVRPTERGHGGEFRLNLQIINLHEK